MKFLVTGASGNVGKALLRALAEKKVIAQVFAGVPNVEEYANINNEGVKYRRFDFEKHETAAEAMDGIDVVFLLRPPHISDVRKYFVPLINEAEKARIKHIVFLSVQGAETKSIIPHNKIERIIAASSVPYTFIRPGYFMQNLATTLYIDVNVNKEICLPAGNAKFNWTDVDDIGEAVAAVMNSFEEHRGRAYTITGSEQLSFGDVVAVMNRELGINIKYKSINPISYIIKKYSEGMKLPYALVMVMLHFLPRFESLPPLSDDYTTITGKSPTRFAEYIKREEKLFVNR